MLNTFFLGNTYFHWKVCDIDSVAGKSEITKHSSCKYRIKLVNGIKDQKTIVEMCSTSVKLDISVSNV